MIKKHKILIIFITFYFFLKLLYLYYLKLPLSYDEAYYWDWSRALSWGYYSKPPMVAWLIKLSTLFFGNSEFAVRLPALLCNVLFLIFSYLVVERYFSQKKAFYLLLTLAVLPILTVYSFIMTIDPPLILFWGMATYFFCLYIEKPNYKNAFLTGIFIGLGLLSKQTMAAFWVLSFLYLIIFKRNFLLKKETLLLFLLPVLIYSPNLYWNYKHQFIMFIHTEHHFSRTGLSFGRALIFFLECTAIYSLFLPVFLIKGLKYPKNVHISSHTLNFLYILSFPLTLFFVLLNIYIKLNTNWIMPFVLSGIVFIFSYLEFKGFYKKLFIANLFLTGLISGITLYSGFYYKEAPSPIKPIFSKFIGWRKLAKEVERFYKPGLPIVASDRRIAGTLAFYLKEHPHVYTVKTKKLPEDQYQIWRNDKSLSGKRIIFVGDQETPPAYLKSPVRLSELKVIVTKRRHKVFSIWKGVWRR